MKEYMFVTTAAISEKYEHLYWIDENIIKPKRIKAENLKEAVKKYAEYTDDQYITITPNAIKDKVNMYIGDEKQIGYVIKAHTDINNKSITLDLWVEIMEINYPDFE